MTFQEMLNHGLLKEHPEWIPYAKIGNLLYKVNVLESDSYSYSTSHTSTDNAIKHKIRLYTNPDAN